MRVEVTLGTSLSLSLSLPPSLPLSLSPSLPLSLSPSLPPSLPLSLSPSLPLSLPPPSLSLLSIVPDDDFSVGFRPCVLLVSGRLVRSELQNLSRSRHRRPRSTWKAMAEIVIMLVFVMICFLQCGSFLFEWPASTVVDMVQEYPSFFFDHIFVFQPLSTTKMFPFG